MKKILLIVCLAVSLTNCRHAPPNLNPQATAAWYGTRVIKNLDLLRDTAIDANAQKPPILNTPTTRKVVLYHESAIKIIHNLPTGWKAGVSTGLDELVKNLSPSEKQLLVPYVTLIKTVLQEVSK